MNKLGLFFCLLLAISSTQSQEIDGYNITELYDQFIIIAKGMAVTNETKCSNTLINHKKTIFPVVKACLENFNNQQELSNILMAAALPIMMIPNIVKDCSLDKIIEILPKFSNFTIAQGFKYIGQIMIDRADEFEKIFNEFFESTETAKDGILIAIGKIIRIITGISFQ